jgi:hypothetical protein
VKVTLVHLSRDFATAVPSSPIARARGSSRANWLFGKFRLDEEILAWNNCKGVIPGNIKLDEFQFVKCALGEVVLDSTCFGTTKIPSYALGRVRGDPISIRCQPLFIEYSKQLSRTACRVACRKRHCALLSRFKLM